MYAQSGVLAWILIALLTGVEAVAEDGRVPLESVPIASEHAILYKPGATRDLGTPMALKAGPHLFLDDYLIASSDSLVRSVRRPERAADVPNPIVTGIEDGCFQPYMSILRDDKTGRFRIWYGHRTEEKNAGRSLLGYMESPDGIHFERPARVLTVPDEIQFGVAVIDDGPHSPDPATRYKYGWYLNDGLRVAASPDGLAWSSLAPGSVLLHNHDINGIYRDTIRNRYVAIASVYREGGAWEGKRRITMQAHSDDLVHWSPAHHVVLPDLAREEGEVQFYAMDGFLARGDLMIGMVKVLRDDLKADDPPNPPDAYGIGYTTLAWSRDGETWVRDPEPFFERDLNPDAWDHSHAWIDEQVPVGDEIYLYYGGYAHGHKVNRFEERQIGLVKKKRDRYVGWLPPKRGTLTTRPLLLEASGFRVNADVARDGMVRVRVLNANNEPIPGYGYDDMVPVTGDQLEAEVNWKKSLADLRGTPVRLEFDVDQAVLYGFYL